VLHLFDPYLYYRSLAGARFFYRATLVDCECEHSAVIIVAAKNHEPHNNNTTMMPILK
jgi:hypothetical protein